MAWIQKKYYGSPGTNGNESLDIILSRDPVISEISQIDFSNLDAPYVYVWNQKFKFDNGTYQFNVTSDDGVRVYVNGVIVLDKWFDQTPSTYRGNFKVLSSETEIRVEYYNDRGLGVAQFQVTRAEDSLSTTTEITAINTTSSPQTSPPPSTVSRQTFVSQPIVDLSEVVEISKTYVERAYLKNSLLPIDKETFTVKNRSNNITVIVSMTGTEHVKFVPTTLTLAPNEQRNVNLEFDPTKINNFNEGITDIDCVIAISSNTPVTIPGSTVIKPPVFVPPLPPVQPEFIPLPTPTLPDPTPEPPTTTPNSSVKSITVSPSVVNLVTGGESATFVATVVADNNVSRDVVWSVDKTAIVNFEARTGTAPFTVSSGKNVGSVRLIATSVVDPTIKGFATINVDAAAIPIVPVDPPPVVSPVPVLINRTTGEVIAMADGDTPGTIASDDYTCNRVGEVTREFNDYQLGVYVKCTVEQDPNGGCVEVCRNYGLGGVIDKDFSGGDGIVEFTLDDSGVRSVTKVPNTTTTSRTKLTKPPEIF